MKKLGRKHRQFFRIVAIDGRQPRDGRVLEELGTYAPQVKETHNRVSLRPAPTKCWMGGGALPSEKSAVLFKKYRKKAEEKVAAAAAAKAAAATPAPASA